VKYQWINFCRICERWELMPQLLNIKRGFKEMQ
jgi:hypothetical protein